jgi:hypothetical protein
MERIGGSEGEERMRWTEVAGPRLSLKRKDWLATPSIKAVEHQMERRR